MVEPDADDAQSLEALFNLYIGLTGTEDDGWIFAESQSGKRGCLPLVSILSVLSSRKHHPLKNGGGMNFEMSTSPASRYL